MRYRGKGRAGNTSWSAHHALRSAVVPRADEPAPNCPADPASWLRFQTRLGSPSHGATTGSYGSTADRPRPWSSVSPRSAGRRRTAWCAPPQSTPTTRLASALEPGTRSPRSTPSRHRDRAGAKAARLRTSRLSSPTPGARHVQWAPAAERRSSDKRSVVAPGPL